MVLTYFTGPGIGLGFGIGCGFGVGWGFGGQNAAAYARSGHRWRLWGRIWPWLGLWKWLW